MPGPKQPVREERSGKWSPAQMVKPLDHITSCKFAGLPPFIPSYEKEEVNMWLLLSMEYGRVWLKERHIVQRIDTFDVDDDFLVRSYVKRGLLLRKKEQAARLAGIRHINRYDNVTSKVKIRTKSEIDNLIKRLSKKEGSEASPSSICVKPNK